RHPRNLGYGGNQKSGYRWAMEHHLDVVVLLHGDGQYAPEVIGDLVAPLKAYEADAAFGSRMMVPGSARNGGMPLYKFLGNRMLTVFSNAVVGMSLTEWHSGYRAYRVDALRDIPFESNSDGFAFDTEIILQLHEAGKVITEVPIPTYYGDEICYVNGMKYAKDVVKDVVEYRLAAKGFGTPDWVPSPNEYAFKDGDGTSHAVILEMMADLPPSRVLDLGCSGGLLAERVRACGHTVIGVDYFEIPGVRERVDQFYQADLSQGLPPEVGDAYDVVIAGDIIEHLPRPGKIMQEIRQVLRPG